MGYAQIIPDVTFPSSVPRIPAIDTMESAGGLLLIDPMHYSDPWTASPGTRPASGSEMKNLFQQSAQALAGAVAAPVFGWSNSGGGIVERSAKGGLHCRVSSSTTGCWILITIPAAIQAYMMANRSHQFFISQWIRTTEATIVSASPQQSVVSTVIQSNSTFGTRMGTNRAPDNNVGYRTGPLGLTSGVHRMNAGVILPDLGETPVFRAQSQQGTPMMNSSANFQYAPGTVLYRFLIEDLTVSGRTYAEADALDAAAYASAFGTGGRYAGDSWTSV